jgi:hypothetical protein
MFVTLKREGYVQQIVTTRLCSSHCDDKIFVSHNEGMIFASHCDDEAIFMTLQQQGYIRYYFQD